MTQLQETSSNPLHRVEREEYCRRVLRKRYLVSMVLERTLRETSISVGYQESYKLAVAEEQVCKSLWSNIIIGGEGLESIASLNWKDVVQTLRSSKEYSLDRSAPVVNKLSQVWLLYAVDLKRITDINRIHRNLIFDITSSDPVEDFLRVELPTEFLKIPSKFLPQITPEIIEFCSRKRITSYLPTAVNLVERSFSSTTDLKINLEKDPETGEEWLVLNVTIQGEIDEVLNNYDNYTIHWVSSVPWPERHKIRLSYNII